jgi:Ser/Thr protein kinase RdoA (MazF antagonist)
VTEPEAPLAGGDITTVVRVGETVRRRPGPWTPAVHALLRHLEEAGFDGAPRALGFDEQGREVLSFVPGEPALAPVPAGDEIVSALGELLRRLHEATRGFVPPPDARWQFMVGAPREGDVVCHRDLFWSNVILRDGMPVALIDWDLAAPAPRLYDLASAANFWAPLRPDEDAREWGLPADRRGPRLRGLCDGYGLDAGERAELLDVVAHQNRIGLETLSLWGGELGLPGWAEMWRAGGEKRILAKSRWLDEHRAGLERWLR